MSVTTEDLKVPADHEERMRTARRMAAWELGDPYWADLLVEAYLYPGAMSDYLDREDKT